MPLVRFQVRNEYGLGSPELYREANREDPKAVLDGVAVAGLVGILRQLGDLAEFAAEVFHDIQEQLMSTASRSHRLMVRVQNIEAAVSPLEKAILSQRSHLHFAYTAGSEWHPHIHTGQNHFIENDLPRFIMDSYEECSEPPRLHVLDKFDTGGPGSCLKRYSDPTYFRRQPARSSVSNAEKVLRDKEVHIRKKKRAWKRDGELSRRMSLSNLSGRMTVACQNIEVQTSPSQSASTSNATSKFDHGDQSNSSDSKTESGYIECVFHPDYSSKSEEHEPEKLSSPRLKMAHNHTVDSAFLDKQQGDESDNSSHSLSEGQIGSNPSCVKWDEKTEIVEPTGQLYDRVETMEIIPSNFAMETQDTEVKFTTLNKTDLEFDVENTPTPISNGYHMEENESEPDSYKDALNTIESESETDLDCQTKREVPLPLSSIDGVVNCMHGPKPHHSDHNPMNFESHSPNKLTSQARSNSSTSEYWAHALSSETVGGSSNPDNSIGFAYSGTANGLEGSNIGSVACKISYSGSGEPNIQAIANDNIISSCSDPKKSPSKLPGFHSVTIWTNGGLLGLQPSKPPDFNTLNAVCQDSVTRSSDNINSASSRENDLKVDEYTGNQDMLTKNFGSTLKDSVCSTSCHVDKENDISIYKTFSGSPSAKLASKIQKPFDSFHVDGHGFNKISVASPGMKQPVSSDVKDLRADVSREDGEKSFSIFGLSNRLLVNGFQSNGSVIHYENLEPASYARTGGLEKRNMDQRVAYETFSETHFKDGGGSELQINSPSSSPPLQHMKISFQPVNGFETSKLTLKLPDQGRSHESSRDMFPSFQLVPDSASPFHDDGSDSDDDTFCRSSPYMSDDCHSDNSETNSEPWESGETHRSNDLELYDALRRLSLSESVSSSQEPEVTIQKGIKVDSGLQSLIVENGMAPPHCGRLVNLPSFDILNPLAEQETKCDFISEDLQLSCHEEPTPLPPLPPLQWRVMKPHMDKDCNQDDGHDAPNHRYDMKLVGSTISMQSKSSAVKQQQSFEETIALKPLKPDERKDGNKAMNIREMDDKEDFLQQIRSKAFSLRRTSTGVSATATATATAPPNQPLNTKVTAILQKANAIRQVVGSDDGEDDDVWSDT